jgi:uncharacterized damage-inducible protein DinB
MTYGQSLVAEFDQEMAITRRVLERVPSDKAEWKPHAKSFAMGHLAQLVARMPGWVTKVLREPALDLSQGAAYTFEKTDTLLQEFDRHVREGRDALMTASAADFDADWSLTMGPKTLMTLNRRVVVRQTINHLVHHRGQLTVYLRLVDVPVPSVYGPTADEGWGR